MAPSISRTITSDEVIALGDSGPDSIGSFTISVTSLTGTLAMTPKGRVTGSGVSSGEYVGLAYTVASTGTVTAASTPISAEGIYFIRADGCDVFLDCDLTAASFKLDVLPRRG
jgi:hypothetical protein